MARIYDITPHLQRRREFEAEDLDAGAFDATREKIFGSRARAAALLLTKTQDELVRGFRNSPEDYFEMEETLSALMSECEAIQKIADAAVARFIMVGNKICAGG